MASSIGSRDSVSFLLTIQATGLLTFTLVGLPPTEYASLRWTHPHALRIPPRDGHPALRKTARIGSRSALAVSRFRLRARLGFSIPLPLSGPRGITPAFGYGAPHPSARGTSTPLNNALLSAHYEPSRHRLVFSHFPGFHRLYEVPCPTGLGNRLIFPDAAAFGTAGVIQRRERLGGMLNYYYRAAA